MRLYNDFLFKQVGKFGGNEHIVVDIIFTIGVKYDMNMNGEHSRWYACMLNGPSYRASELA